jgi:hypothetical protein
MTLADLTALVVKAARAKDMEPPTPDEVEAWESRARRRAARSAINEQHRALLETTITPSIASNFADLSAQTDLLIESIPVIDDVRHSSVASGAQGFIHKKTRRELDYLKTGTAFAYYVVGKDGIYVKYPAGTLADASTLTVRVIKIPTLAAWPAAIEDRLVDAVITIYREKMGQFPPEEVNSGVVPTLAQ